MPIGLLYSNRNTSQHSCDVFLIVIIMQVFYVYQLQPTQPSLSAPINYSMGQAQHVLYFNERSKDFKANLSLFLDSSIDSKALPTLLGTKMLLGTTKQVQKAHSAWYQWHIGNIFLISPSHPNCACSGVHSPENLPHPACLSKCPRYCQLPALSLWA